MLISYTPRPSGYRLVSARWLTPGKRPFLFHRFFRKISKLKKAKLRCIYVILIVLIYVQLCYICMYCTVYMSFIQSKSILLFIRSTFSGTLPIWINLLVDRLSRYNFLKCVANRISFWQIISASCNFWIRGYNVRPHWRETGLISFYAFNGWVSNIF